MAEATAPPADEPQSADESVDARGTAALRKVANGSASDAEAQNATDWFVGEDGGEELTDSFKLNVGSKKTPRWIVWTIKSLEREYIDAVRKQERSGDEVDANRVNLRLAASATVDPNLQDLRGDYADPADALQRRFQRKGGLIDQIANRVVELSGYDDDDIKEIDAVKP